MTGRIQRIGAYGIVLGGDRILLSRISQRGHPAGYWNLPGGRIEHGEDPRATLRREVMEETGLRVTAAELVDVTSTHLTGPGYGGVWEDFHGLAVMYRVNVDDTGIGVLEVDGTTDAVEWVERDQVRERHHLTIVDDALNYLSSSSDGPSVSVAGSENSIA